MMNRLIMQQILRYLGSNRLLNHQLKLTMLLLIYALMCTASVPCGVISISGSSSFLVLGIIGDQGKGESTLNFHTEAIPLYEEPIRLSVRVSNHSKRTYKDYKKMMLEKGVRRAREDTMRQKSQYLRLELMDKVQVISALAKEENSSILQYMQTQQSARLVTAIMIALPPKDQQAVLAAEAVFLKNTGYKQYGLSLWSGGKATGAISLSKGVVFDHELSAFCWGDDTCGKARVMDIVNKPSDCPKGTRKEAMKPVRKVNYFKL